MSARLPAMHVPSALRCGSSAGPAAPAAHRPAQRLRRARPLPPIHRRCRVKAPARTASMSAGSGQPAAAAAGQRAPASFELLSWIPASRFRDSPSCLKWFAKPAEISRSLSHWRRCSCTCSSTRASIFWCSWATSPRWPRSCPTMVPSCDNLTSLTVSASPGSFNTSRGAWNARSESLGAEYTGSGSPRHVLHVLVTQHQHTCLLVDVIVC
ncbi:hypothetical protein DL89DRAFT_28710 [Linderina pennispora]|uniref:Uncharacterized protein n=1 Tax=Linderina pennispora TaxID=61395 RepID=A0A1Y1W3V1_9FUNG|nr:uncharacterized protein DL89DRAFT_28710 [Linderina pennispora]ORX68240.1 hypothetical protein DL89DRAFT_28710 [Linderina pennispora]